jgi:hypothetical protein
MEATSDLITFLSRGERRDRLALPVEMAVKNSRGHDGKQQIE